MPSRRDFRRIFSPALACLALAFAFPASPALAQNLLVNPGFDRDLSGWTVSTTTSPPSPLPGEVEASASWTSSDVASDPSSGGVALHAKAFTMSIATATAGQCVPMIGGTLASFGVKFLTTRQYVTAQSMVTVTFFAAADCSGTPSASASATSLASSVLPGELSSGGVWLLASSQAIAPTGTRSARLDVGVRATGTMAYGLSYVDSVADDAYITAAPASLTTMLLPSAAWVYGAGGAYWHTALTLVNPGITDATATLKFLGHDTDGRGRSEREYVVHGGQTLVLDEEEWEINHQQDYGAILMTSTSPAVFLQSETSTFLSIDGSLGSVGQALPSLGSSDFAGATPKTLAPIRQNISFRTNLVLANPTEVALTAHIALFAADGTPIGTRDVDLPALGMTQINRVASALGAAVPLDVGRLAISTPTPGGLVAAYASVIDNVTSDPRTLLPR